MPSFSCFRDMIIDDFKTIIRETAIESNKTISEFFIDLFSASDIAGFDCDKFIDVVYSIRSIKKKLKKEDLRDVFEECNENTTDTITMNVLVEFCQRKSKARTIALKLRAAIVTNYKDEVEYRRIFDSIKGSGPFAEVDKFREFAEETLDIVINESDGNSLYRLFDADGDGNVSVDDFVVFLLAQSLSTSKIMETGNGNVIVDIRVSSTRVMDGELTLQGYQMISPNSTKEVASAIERNAFGSFGRGQSMWVWRRKQGTCRGRLKPIVDIQLDGSYKSTALVLSGYLCLPITISGQYVWIRRANSVEEEVDALVDIQVTIGRAKNPTDAIHSGPGVGWVRVDGNFGKGLLSPCDVYLWFRASRIRSLDVHMSSPIRSAVVLSEEMRYAKLFAYVQIAIRHYVPYNKMKELAAPTSSMSEQVMDAYDYTSLYYQFDTSGKQQLSQNKLEKLLCEIGIRVDKADVGRCFRFFNVKQDNYISQEEYALMLALTEHELDVVLNLIRSKLLSCRKDSTNRSSSKTNTSAQIRENKFLSSVFSLINLNGDGVLCSLEVKQFCNRLEVYVTESEVSQILAAMDVAGNDRVEESDFISFMKKPADITSRKTFRVRETAVLLRGWLRRRSPTGVPDQNSPTGGDSAAPHYTHQQVQQQQHLWNEFKTRHEKLGGGRSPGYLGMEDIKLVLAASLGIRLAPVEVRELIFMIAPDKNGKIHASDLNKFMFRTCRSIGELLAIMDRDVMKPIIEMYRKLRVQYATDTREEDEDDIENLFKASLKEVDRAVQDECVREAAIHKTSASSDSNINLEVVPLSALKIGLEDVLRGYQTPEDQMPTLEEWACLSCVAGADVLEEEQFGVKCIDFLEGMCSLIAGDIGVIQSGDTVSLDMLCKDLRRMFYDEAVAAALANSKGKNDIQAARRQPDFEGAFEVFDENRSGSISLDEFQELLVRLQLVDALPEDQLPALINIFDKSNTGSITLESFVAFIKDGSLDFAVLGDDDIEEDVSDDDHAGGHVATTSMVPPVAITANADCDYLLWYLWRECMSLEPSDPQGVVTEMETCCAELELAYIQSSENGDHGVSLEGVLEVNELWDLLDELRLRRALSKPQFSKSIKKFLQNSGSGKKKSKTQYIDYEFLCRCVIKMGRAFNSKVQEKTEIDSKKFKELKKALFADMLMTVASESKGSHRNVLSQYEKVFKRLDGDGDGKVTVQEFKMGLRRMKLNDEKYWTLSMIRSLFDEIDLNKDGLLSIEEFRRAVTAGEYIEDVDTCPQNSTVEVREYDGDAGSSRKKKVLTGYELYRKICSILETTVSLQASLSSTINVGPRTSMKETSSSQSMVSTVRKFFKRSDADDTGYVPESRFRAFCRRSSVIEKLSSVEFRQLLHDIQDSKSKSELINYERFCKQIASAAESVSSSQVSQLMGMLERAFEMSESAGHSFVSLCSLLDPSNKGSISDQEFIHVVKMMDGSKFSVDDVAIINELLASSVTSSAGSNYVDYVALNAFVCEFSRSSTRDLSNEDQSMFDRYGNRHENVMSSMSNHSTVGAGALPSYSTPGVVTFIENGSPAKTEGGRNGLSGPCVSTHNPLSTNDSSHIYDKTVQHVYDKAYLALSNTKHGSSNAASLLKRVFQAEDKGNQGVLPLQSFHSILTQDLNIDVSATDLHAFIAKFGQHHGEYIDYEQFCSSCVRQTVSSSRSLSAQQSTAPYFNNRVLLRYHEIIAENNDANHRFIRKLFPEYDQDRAGLVDARVFRGMLRQLGLFQTEYQLNKVVQDFCYSNHSQLISYEDFCSAIEVSYLSFLENMKAENTSLTTSTYAPARREPRSRPNAGTKEHVEHKHWLTRESTTSPKSHVYASLNRENDVSQQRSTSNHFYSRRPASPSKRIFEDIDVGNERLFSPKPSNSLLNNKQRHRSRYANDNSYSYGGISKPLFTKESLSEGYENRSGRGTSGQSVFASLHSPSRAGASMCGTDMPILKKGEVPTVAGRWVCNVCFYTDNAASAQQCEVCDSANHEHQKDTFGLKDQCQNCAFMNDCYAKECDMCGDPMGPSNSRLKS